jgi:anti-sigma B factor antagonist
MADATISVRSDDDIAVLVLRGELDIHNVPQLADALQSLVHVAPRPIIVDLTDTTFIDSSAVGALIGGHRAGLRYSVRGASAATRRALKTMGLSSLLDF